MRRKRSPLCRARRRGREKGCACAAFLPLPLPGVNLPLPFVWRTLNTVTDALAARGWPWCPTASRVVDHCHVVLEAALDAPEGGRFAQ